MLANTEMQIAACVFARLEVARAFKFQRRLVRGGQVCRTTDEPGYVLRDGVQDFSRAVSGSQAFRIRGECRQVFVPSFGQFVVPHSLQTIRHLRVFLRVRRIEFLPLSAQFPSALSDPFAEVLAHALGHKKFGVFGPAVKFLDQPNFFLPQGFAVRRVRVLFVRRSVADVTVHDN